MKFLNLLLVFFAIGMITSCGSDGDCTTSDWIGTYKLDVDSQDCSSENISLNDIVVIEAGTLTDEIDFDGIEVSVNGCSIEATDPFFGSTITAELDGNQITVSGLGCTGTYIRQ